MASKAKTIAAAVVLTGLLVVEAAALRIEYRAFVQRPVQIIEGVEKATQLFGDAMRRQ